MPVDVLGLATGRQRYGFFTNADGGVIDDLMIAHCGDHFLLFVNASRKVIDEGHLRAAVSRICTIEVLEDRALLALQGPEAESALARLAPDSAAMRFMDVRSLSIAGSACLVTRSGYTGEDGFEINVAASEAEKLARVFLEDISVAFAGLGARDSLRTEAGLCLYGSISTRTRRRSKRRWNGRSRKSAAVAAPALVVSPVRTCCWRQLDDGPRGARRPAAARSSARARGSYVVCRASLRPNLSARLHLEASDLQ